MPLFLKLITVLGLTLRAIGGFKLSKARFARGLFRNIGWLSLINPFMLRKKLGSLGWISEKT
jgi:hypothetical protein